jgi:hypothetical protein
MRIGYVGNFEPAHSTENHLRLSMEALDHEVIRHQENATDFGVLTGAALRDAYDLIVWTRTWSGDAPAQTGFLDAMQSARIPTVAIHLDRYWGLARQSQIGVEPWWRCDWVFSADGGNDDRFAEAGINHRWFQPGVLATECEAGRVRPRYRVDVAFVGSYGYHPEWSYRPRLIDWLERSYRGRFKRWPHHQQVRGRALADLYASAKVIIGDSCLTGFATRYWSDRIPETLGRCGFLIHPYVDGLEDHYSDGEHLRLYRLGDFKGLRALIDYYLEHQDEARRIAAAGMAHVREHHTYLHRMRDVLEVVAPKVTA